MEVVINPKCEAHVLADSRPMAEHSPGSISDHVVQSRVDVRILDHTFFPKDISVSYILADSRPELDKRMALSPKFTMSVNMVFTHSIGWLHVGSGQSSR